MTNIQSKSCIASAVVLLSFGFVLSACSLPSATAVASTPATSEAIAIKPAPTQPALGSSPMGAAQDTSSLPACTAQGILQDSRLNASSQEWLAQRVAQLADRLPDSLSKFTQKGIQFGEGGLTKLQGALNSLIDEEVSPDEGFTAKAGDLATGVRFYLAAPAHLQPEGTARLVLVILSSQTADTSGGDRETPAPPPLAPYSAPPGPSASVRVEVLDKASGLWMPICEDVVLPANTAGTSVTEVPTEQPIVCVTLLKPVNSAEIPPVGKVEFSWTPMEKASNYVLQIILPSGETIYFKTDETFRDRYMEAFVIGGKYQWQVTAQGFDGSEICVSEVFTFDKPAYEKPNDGGNDNYDGGGDDECTNPFRCGGPG